MRPHGRLGGRPDYRVCRRCSRTSRSFCAPAQPLAHFLRLAPARPAQAPSTLDGKNTAMADEPAPGDVSQLMLNGGGAPDMMLSQAAQLQTAEAIRLQMEVGFPFVPGRGTCSACS